MTPQLSESNQGKLLALKTALDLFRFEGGCELSLSTTRTDAGAQSISDDDTTLIKRIDEEIMILHDHVAEVHLLINTLCRMRDQLSPTLIHKLPPEVLSEILQMATSSEPKAAIQLRNQLSLERVCRHWRKLMDAVPRIFAEASHSRNERVVSQSGDLPLHIVAGHYNGRFFDFSERYIHRWRSLQIKGFTPDAWLQRFHHAAPLLQSLEVKTGYLPRWPRTLNPFDGKAPQLRHLRMLYAPLPWNNSLIRGLQSLHFMLDLDPEQHVPYSLKLRHILQNCPQLQDLVLSGPFTRQGYDPSLIGQRSNNIIHLPQLRQLILCKTKQSHVVRWFLDTVRAPSLESLSLGPEFIDVAELTATFEGLPVGGILSMPSGTLCVTLGENLGRWIQVNSEVKCNSWQAGLIVASYVGNTSTYEGSPIDFVATIFPFWTHLIRTLELHDGNTYKFPKDYGDTTGGFLVELVELEKLIVKHSTIKASSIITALGSPIAGKDSSLLLWPCPKLTCLELGGKGWLNLVEVVNCIRSRYGVLDDYMVKGHCTLPVRLEKLVISPGSRCPESVDTDYNSAMAELKELVGNNVINLVDAQTLS